MRFAARSPGGPLAGLPEDCLMCSRRNAESQASEMFDQALDPAQFTVASVAAPAEQPVVPERGFTLRPYAYAEVWALVQELQAAKPDASATLRLPARRLT